MSEFHDRVRPQLESLLEPGEELRGFVAATQQSTFKGRLVALAATDRRLIVLPLDRKIEPKGEPISITPEQVADAKAGGRERRLGRRRHSGDHGQRPPRSSRSGPRAARSSS